MISVLLPSRGRPHSLRATIGRLLHTARTAAVEVWVAADPDDPATADTATQAGAQVWVAPLRHGYARLHEYYNQLAARARGDWLLLWNDDADMRTPAWDMRIEESPVGVLAPRSNGPLPGLCCFPVVSAPLVAAMGHMSLSPHVDSWLVDVAAMAGCLHPVDVDIWHDRADLTGGHDDATYREGRSGLRTAEYYTPGMAALRAADTETIRRVLL